MKIVLPVLAATLAFAPTALAAPGPSVTAKIGSGLSYKARPYVLKGDNVTVVGTLKPALPGQRVRVELYRHSTKIAQSTVNVRADGTYTAKVRAKAEGPLGLWAIHPVSATQARSQSSYVGLTSIVPKSAPGSGGLKVRLLQVALARLGYVTGHGTHFGPATARSVIAFRKVNQMARITTASKYVYRLLFAGQGGFKLKYPNAGPGGKHVEFDWSRQVLVLARGGTPVRIYHASSGKPSTPTVFGTYHFYRRGPGTNHLGMVWTTYFYGGYAIHGYHSVPTYAASHGCIRVPVPNALSIYRWLNLGDVIFIYH